MDIMNESKYQMDLVLEVKNLSTTTEQATLKEKAFGTELKDGGWLTILISWPVLHAPAQTMPDPLLAWVQIAQLM